MNNGLVHWRGYAMLYILNNVECSVVSVQRQSFLFISIFNNTASLLSLNVDDVISASAVQSVCL